MCQFSAQIGECFWLPIEGQAAHPAVVIAKADAEILVVHMSDAVHGLDPTETLEIGEIECITKPSNVICSAAHFLDPSSLISDVVERNARIDCVASEEVVLKLRRAILNSCRSKRIVQKWLRQHYPG